MCELMSLLNALYRSAVGVLFLWPAVAAADPVSCPIQAPFTIGPSRVDALGNAGASHLGCFSAQGFDDIEISIGTNPVGGFPTGTLVLDFAGVVNDLPGDDFGLLTFSAFGPLGGAARVEFRLNGELQSSIDTILAPSQLFTFDLAGVSANQIRVVNIAPDPPGVDNLAAMSFMDAGVTNPIPTPATTPEPATLVLLFTGGSWAVCAEAPPFWSPRIALMTPSIRQRSRGSR